MSEATKQAIGPNQEKWLKALESGEYQQGRQNLKAERDDSFRYCCLGVGAEMFAGPGVRDGGSIFWWGSCTAIAPQEVVSSLALINDVGSFAGSDIGSLAGMNDEGKTFAEIAAFCREHPAKVFAEPR